MQCKRPDRHVAKLVCGYPLPCPHHSIMIDLNDGGITINIPEAVVNDDSKKDAIQRIIAIASQLSQETADETPPRSKQ